jgi:Raf kinase inhibitor-like YbhB/YbcL family protein
METVVHTILSISSSAVKQNDYLPEKYTCDGININPPLTVRDMPVGTKSLAVLMEDHDAEEGPFNHWVTWNIPPMEGINENSAPGLTGYNGFNEKSYTGPCPPRGIHRYYFKVYALDTILELPENTNSTALEKAMNGHVVAIGELIALYKRAADLNNNQPKT